jgi:uncharacterized protein Yka (UPF0111/DUF47 family)
MMLLAIPSNQGCLARKEIKTVFVSENQVERLLMAKEDSLRSLEADVEKLIEEADKIKRELIECLNKKAGSN